MSNVWQVQDAKARFSEMLETSLAEGPQVVTRRGVDCRCDPGGPLPVGRDPSGRPRLGFR